MRRDEPLARGTEVARFVVLGLVGRGAMGEVYAAHDPDLDRKVAIKLLRGGSGRADGAEDSASGRLRLMREAQAIAKVSHPNVVVVYDVGTFDGRVFIAMEFVDGHTLAYWLQAEPRGIDQILDVFIAAGRGLAAAHERDLIHRDFKPDNVMVSADGQVRVMDFGLARLAIDRQRTGHGTAADTGKTRPSVPSAAPLDDPMSTQIVERSGHRPAAVTTSHADRLTWNLTMDGSVVGTPAYMSPEQSRGEASDARTDQFSFCVALYESLYGERPFAGRNLAELMANVAAGNIRAEKPQARIPGYIRQALARGMSAEPERRFPSMTALLAELRPAGSRRFADGAAAKLAEIWEAPDIEDDEGGGRQVRPETPAKAAMRQAFLATGKPYAANTFEGVCRILDRFTRRWTDIYVEACEATHVRGEQSAEVLDLRMMALGEALSDLRALCRQLCEATPETIENAIKAANALGALERCADVNLLRAIVRPPEDPDTRSAVEQMQGRLSEVRTLARLGRASEGLKAGLALETDARGVEYLPLLCEVLSVLGRIHEDVADFETAVRVLEDATWTAELCRHDEVVAEATATLIFLTGCAQSRFEVGEIWSRHAETVLDRMGGHELIRAWVFNNRGAMRATQGRLREAVDDMNRAIAAKASALGAEDGDVGISIGNAAVYLDDLGETARAAEYHARALTITMAALGPDHPKVAIQLANYAECLNRLGRHEDARDPARRALSIFERETDPNGIYVTYPLMALAISQIGTGGFAEAVPLVERATRIRQAKEKDLSKVAEAHFALGRALWGAHLDRQRAVALVLRAQDEYRRTPPTFATGRELEEIDRWLAREGASVDAAVADANTPESPGVSSSARVA